MYVPVYDPGYFWGAPSPLYPWPGLYYPGIGVGWGWGPGIHLGLYFGGCCGWGGWGWGPGWFNHTVIVNNNFFHRYNYAEFHGRGDFRGNAVWAHDAGHRGGMCRIPIAESRSDFQGGNARGRGRPNAGAVRNNMEQMNRNAERSNNHMRVWRCGEWQQSSPSKATMAIRAWEHNDPLRRPVLLVAAQGRPVVEEAHAPLVAAVDLLAAEDEENNAMKMILLPF